MRISKRIGRFRFDRALLALLILGGLALAGRAWLHDHPQHNPWAPLDLGDPPGWATQRKLAALRSDPAECRAVLNAAASPSARSTRPEKGRAGGRTAPCWQRLR